MMNVPPIQTSMRDDCSEIDGNSDKLMNVLHQGYSCEEFREKGLNKSGVYYLRIHGTSYWYLRVYCDMETDGGGWTVGQSDEQPDKAAGSDLKFKTKTQHASVLWQIAQRHHRSEHLWFLGCSAAT